MRATPITALSLSLVFLVGCPSHTDREEEAPAVEERGPSPKPVEQAPDEAPDEPPDEPPAQPPGQPAAEPGERPEAQPGATRLTPQRLDRAAAGLQPGVDWERATRELRAEVGEPTDTATVDGGERLSWGVLDGDRCHILTAQQSADGTLDSVGTASFPAVPGEPCRAPPPARPLPEGE